MEPDYASFWTSFRDTSAWAGMMAMARFSPDVELRVLRLRVEMLEAIVGSPNTSDLQEAIWRLMELIAGQTDQNQISELLYLLNVHRLDTVFTLLP